jgi:hypothetical protein
VRPAPSAPCRRDAGGVEGWEPVLGRALAEPLGQQRHELPSVLDPSGIRREALVGAELAEPDHGAQRPEQPVVRRGHRDPA